MTAALEKPLGIKSANLIMIDQHSQDVCFAKTANSSLELDEEYFNVYRAFDPAVEWAIKHAHEKFVFSEIDFGPDATPEKNAYYDWWKKTNDTSYRLGAHTMTQDGVPLAVTFHRLTARGPVEAEDLDLFQSLARHITRALALQYKLGGQDQHIMALAEFYDRSEEAILFLDKAGRLTFANAAAERLASQQDGLSITGKGISFHRLSDNLHYQKALAGAMADVAASQAFQILRPSGKSNYLVRITPLGTSIGHIDPKMPRVAVQIVDPTWHRPAGVDALQSIYGLTKAEICLVRILMRGESLSASAQKLGIAYSTARTQLASIFLKTGVNRQADLLRLLDRLA